MLQVVFTVQPSVEPVSRLQMRKVSVVEVLPGGGDGVTLFTDFPPNSADVDVTVQGLTEGGNYRCFTQTQDLAGNWSAPSADFPITNAQDNTPPPVDAPLSIKSIDAI